MCKTDQSTAQCCCFLIAPLLVGVAKYDSIYVCMYILLSTIASGEQIIFMRVVFKRKIFIIVFLFFPKICVATFSLVGSFRRYINSHYTVLGLNRILILEFD